MEEGEDIGTQSSRGRSRKRRSDARLQTFLAKKEEAIEMEQALLDSLQELLSSSYLLVFYILYVLLVLTGGNVCLQVHTSHII